MGGIFTMIVRHFCLVCELEVQCLFVTVIARSRCQALLYDIHLLEQLDEHSLKAVDYLELLATRILNAH